MMPPMQSTVLQPNEGYHHQHNNVNVNVNVNVNANINANVNVNTNSNSSNIITANNSSNNKYSNTNVVKSQQAQQQQQQQQQQQPTSAILLTSHKKGNKLQPLELLVEHKISYSSAAAALTDSTIQPEAEQQTKHQQQLQQHSQQPQRSASSDDCFNITRANIFDDAAENFVINFPADSSQQPLLPLSETVPLLTHIEATVVDKQRAIRLNKNSASLIFTKKDLTTNNTTAAAPSSNRSRNQQYHSLYGIGERQRKQTKHLPPTRTQTLQHHQQQQQQRRSLQLNYNNNNNNSNNNNNLVTTAQCGAAVAAAGGATRTSSSSSNNSSSNSSYCCGNGSNTNTSGNKNNVLHKQHHGVSSPNAASTSSIRKQHSYSWYAPVYSALEEELEQDSRDSSPIHNLANIKQKQQQIGNRLQQQRASYSAAPPHDTNETVALLYTPRHKANISGEITAGGAATGRRERASVPNSLPLPLSLPLQQHGGSVGGGTGAQDADESLGMAGGQLPRRRRIENFLKSLVGLKGSSSSSSRDNGNIGSSIQQPQSTLSASINGATATRPASPEIRITRTPSEQNMVVRDPSGIQLTPHNHHHHQHHQHHHTNGSRNGSTSSLNVVHQKLWHMVRREGSASSLHQEKSQSIVQYTGLRKCETVLALTRPSHSLKTPSDHSLSTTMMMMGANSTGSGIFSASGVEQIRPLNRLRNSVNSLNAAVAATTAGGSGGGGVTCSRCSSILSLAASGSRYSLANSYVNRSSNNPVDPMDEEQEPSMHINVNAHIRLSGGSGSGTGGGGSSISNTNTNYGSRKSSDQSNSSNSPPSNVTTATLHSNHHIITTTTPTATQSDNMGNADEVDLKQQMEYVEQEQQLESLEEPSSSMSNNMMDVGAFGTTHAYPLTVSSLLSMATANQAAQACCVRDGITLRHREMLASADVTPTAATTTTTSSSTPPPPSSSSQFQPFTCKLCLIDVENAGEATTLLQCSCQFCTECMHAYVEFEISEGAYEISCPDAKCPAQGAITLPEIANLTTTNLLKKHHRYRLNREIELDKTRTWCPRAGCETICIVGGTHSAICQIDESPSTSATSQSQTPLTSADNCGTGGGVGGSGGGSSGTGIILSVPVHCPSCKDEFCGLCKKAYHPNISCEEFGRRLVADGQDDIGIPFDNELIKCCPMCAVPIEKDEGCAQMMCKRCKHVFCWYCLASLDDDFLLRHYDKGPCKNKLGHSRASVVWHRAQVIGIFAGFGILLLVASPLLLLAAPCIICCKCRGCSGSKIDEGDGELEEEITALQG